MTIVTKKGDGGATCLRYGRPVSKSDDRVEAYGTVDELGSALGLAKAFCRDSDPAGPWVSIIERIQDQLLAVGADLATTPEDHARKAKPQFRPECLEWLESEVAVLEKQVRMEGFVLPGANPPSAAFHVARTVCRRAERQVTRLLERSEEPAVRVLLPYLNRLSDFLWLAGERLAQQPL
jgi:cob(I)alamin adenosyltransferase